MQGGKAKWVKSVNGPDILDLVTTIHGLEEINGVKITFGLTREQIGSRQDLQVTAMAWGVEQDPMAAPPLALVSVTCLGTNLTTMDAVLTHLLYMLDGAIARAEMDSAK